MRNSVIRVCVVVVALMAWPRIASAQWYVNPYIGQITGVKNPFVDPVFPGVSIPSNATAFGVAAGTSPLGRVGFEIDYQRVNGLFRTGDTRLTVIGFEALTGDNDLQSLTGAVHVGRAFGAGGRFRPYGVAGGGLNIINLGQEVKGDLETFQSLPPGQLNAIAQCVVALGTATPTVAQAQGCGFPFTSEEIVANNAVLTFGGGVTAKLANNVAAKGDVRYFKEIPTDPAGPFSFWRITFGVVIHR